jgi:hypothetical protein
MEKGQFAANAGTSWTEGGTGGGGGATEPTFVQMVHGNGPTIIPEVELISIYFGSFAPTLTDDIQSYLQHFVAYLGGAGAPPGKEPVLFQYGMTGADLGTSITVANSTAPFHEYDIVAKIRNLSSFSLQRLFLAFVNGLTVVGSKGEGRPFGAVL